jgi:nickel-dependent lactate racemase
MKNVHLPCDTRRITLRVPDHAHVLEGRDPRALPDPARAVMEALDNPTGSLPLARILADRRPSSAAITIPDITRPAPNREVIGPLLETLNRAGVPDAGVVIVIGTGMHRPSTDAERESMLGRDVLERVEVVDHRADRPQTLVRVSEDPPISMIRRFVEADVRIVTGLVEPHFMAGFSGGPKGVLPALVDLESIGRFHGQATLADPLATTGVIEGNPCQQIARDAARRVGVDFLVNTAIDRERRLAAVFAGDVVQAHEEGCRQVASWAAVEVDSPHDLVVTSAGGAPLDRTYYQTVKAMVGALPALGPDSTLLVVAGCEEGIGSPSYRRILERWDGDWRGFLDDIAGRPSPETDQWQHQMQCRVLERIGAGRLLVSTGGIVVSRHLCATPAPDPQRIVDAHADGRIAVVPDGPYTMLAGGVKATR